MFDVVKNIYQGDVLRPHIFGSLGIIAGKRVFGKKRLWMYVLSSSGIKIS
jgi:hypothetical protein